MKRLLLSLIALAIPFATVLGIAEWRLSRVRWNEYAAKRSLFERQAAKVEVLVLGSSHAYRGILPALLGPHAFSFAGVSQSLYYDRAILEKYLDSSPSLKTVILPISYFTLESQLDEGIEKWRCYYYRYEYGLRHRDWHMTWSARNYSACFLGGQELGWKHILRGKIPDVLSRFDECGGDATPRSSPETEETSALAQRLQSSAQTALQRHHAFMRPGNFEENRRILDSLVQELEHRGIEAVLVTVPVSRYYAGGMDPVRRQQMQAALRDICSSHGARYFNYSADERFFDRDFFDGDHLNHAGAVKFSRILMEETVAQSRPR